MKIAILSDSHNKTEGIDTALSKVCSEVNAVIHLGDGCSDLDKYRPIYPNVEFFDVCGNCDYAAYGKVEQTFELAGKRIFITHGHLHDVKFGNKKIISAAKNNSADICMFGHTHEAAIFYDEKTLFINPGSITFGDDKGHRSFAMLEITDWNVDANIMHL